jgi:hypothetical protein
VFSLSCVPQHEVLVNDVICTHTQLASSWSPSLQFAVLVACIEVPAILWCVSNRHMIKAFDDKGM